MKRYVLVYVYGFFTALILLVLIFIGYGWHVYKRMDNAIMLRELAVKQKSEKITNNIKVYIEPVVISCLPYDERSDSVAVFEILYGKAEYLNDNDLQDLNNSFRDFSDKMKSRPDRSAILAREYVLECKKIADRH
nr:hypothetical protein [uncultured Holophaga sp.]